jgi:signal transduction histidine kinase
VRIRRSNRDWAVDIGLVLIAVVVGGVFMLGALAEEPPPNPQQVNLELAIGGVACIGLLPFRRRWPVELVLALIPATIMSSAAMGAMTVALFTLAVYRDWRVTVVIAAVQATALAVVWRFAIDDSAAYWQVVATVLAVHAALIASGMLVRSQRMLVRSLEDRALQAEEGQQLRIREARHLERERLAREMHDVLAHRISLLAVHAGALEVRRTAPDDERQAVGIIRTAAYEALEDLREVIGMLRDGLDAPDVPQPTLADVSTLVEHSREAGTTVSLDNRLADVTGVPTGIGRHAYRVVQEGLTNCRKHAPGGEVHVRLDGGAARGLTVEILNAVPADRPASQIPGTGTGLVGLRERMDLIGGQLEHGRTPDGGFRLRAWLPCPA